MIKLLLLFPAFLVMGLQTPYLLQAWNSSRLDHWDWLFYLCTVPAVLWAIRSEKKGRYDWYALFLLVPSLLLALMTSFHHINALSVIGAAGVLFAAVWGLYSWPFAYRLLPAAIILLQGTPSSSYQLSLLLMCPVWAAWSVKIAVTVLCLVWIWCNRSFDLQIKKGTVFFSAALLGSCLLLLHTRELYFKGRSFIPEFSGHVGDFWGRKIQPDENTRRFFATSIVRQYRYTRNDTDLSVLAVRCGKDIHEIHPASHCLRTSQWTVNSEKIFHLRDNFAVTEIDARKGNTRILVWVWYSSTKFSTPGFLGFRRQFRPGGIYYTYQISVPVWGNIDESRAELKNFIQRLKRRYNHDAV